MIVIVCGLSGSGKTSLVEKTDLASIRFEQVKASDILREEGRPTKGLRASEVFENQNCIARHLEERLKKADRLLIDGHLLIETADGPQLVPDTSLAGLPIAAIVTILTSPEIIASRRWGRASNEFADEISDLMLIEETHARRIARNRAIPYFAVGSDNATGLLSILQQAIRTAEPENR